MINRWIQKIGMKKDVFSNQLGIPPKQKIPMSLLNKIISAKPGDVITNPTKTGKRILKVTLLLKRRAILVRNLKRISEKRRSS